MLHRQTQSRTVAQKTSFGSTGLAISMCRTAEMKAECRYTIQKHPAPTVNYGVTTNQCNVERLLLRRAAR